jgi:drug/metabolite transporter (DMT)-like permease
MALLETSSKINGIKKLRIKKGNWVADLLLLLVAIIWGSTYITSKTVISVYPVFLFLFLRFALTVVMMAPFTMRHYRQLSKDTWRVGGILGIFLFLIYSFETIGIFYTSASSAAFLISLCVVMTPIVEGAVYKKYPGTSVIGVVMLSVIGTGMLTLKEGVHFNYGNLMILAAALLRAIQMTYTKKLTKGKELDSAALTTIQMLVVTVLTGIISLVMERDTYNTLHSSMQFWVITLYLAIFGTLFAFYVQMTMIRLTSPVRVGLLLGTEPLFGAVFAILLGGESFSTIGIIGGGIIVAATYLGRQIESRRQMVS